MSATPVVSCCDSEGFSPTHPGSLIFGRHHRAGCPAFSIWEQRMDCLKCSSFRLPGVEGLRESRKQVKVTGLQMSGIVTA